MSEAHRPWREQLGALVLGHLTAEEEAPVRAHLDGCAECRSEADELRSVVSVLPAGDLERVSATVPPPARLEERVFARLSEARRFESLRRRHRLRTRIVSGLAAAAVVIVAVVVADRGTRAPDAPQQPGGVELVSFTGVPPGAEAVAELTETDEGLDVHLRMRGMPGGDWVIAVERNDGTEEESETFGAPSGGWTGRRTLRVDRDEATALKIRHTDGSNEFVEPLPSP